MNMALNVAIEIRAIWNALTTEVQDILVEMGWNPDTKAGYPVLTGAGDKPRSSNPADHMRWLKEHAVSAEKSLNAAVNSAAVSTDAVAPVQPSAPTMDATSVAAVVPDNVSSASIHEANNATTGTVQAALDDLNK